MIEPTKDLADQVHQEMSKFMKYIQPPLQQTLLIGGVDNRAQERELASGTDVVVGTPHRIMDMIKRKKLDTSEVKFFILDEADRMCDKDTRIGMLVKILRSGRTRYIHARNDEQTARNMMMQLHHHTAHNVPISMATMIQPISTAFDWGAI